MPAFVHNTQTKKVIIPLENIAAVTSLPALSLPTASNPNYTQVTVYLIGGGQIQLYEGVSRVFLEWYAGFYGGDIELEWLPGDEPKAKPSDPKDPMYDPQLDR